MKRLLCIVSAMNQGGAETFLMKMYRSLDKTKYQMDFCVFTDKEAFYDAEIISLGGKIFHTVPKSKHPIKCFNEIKRIVKEENYQYVLRTSQQSLAALDLFAAKLGGAKKLIYRSSNAGLTGGFANKFINKFFSFLPKIIPNVKIAPSTEAAEFVFGKNSIKNGKAKILHNGLDYKIFEFNEKKRNKIRKELKIEKKKVYGHIGRFNEQKNHLFLLDIFKEISLKEPNSILILIGTGELEEKIKDKIKELNLEKKVMILSPQPNVNEYMMAMDILIFPSFFEGMPNVVIEAQATGLLCVISDKITREAKITDLVIFKSLEESAKDWANELLKIQIKKRSSQLKNFSEKKYLVEDVEKEFIRLVF